MKITKKRFVLIALFIFPLLFFLFLSTGINKFVKLPVLTQKVMDIKELDTIDVTFKNNVTVLCFLGKEINTKKGGLFNLNQKIYKEFYGYLPFQLIAIYPKGEEVEVLNLKNNIGEFTNMSKWRFISLSDKDIYSFYQSLKSNIHLDENLSSNYAFVIDKDLSLRGRNDDKDVLNGLLYGYNMNSVAELNNKMEDDIKVLLYEYRAAFKNKKKANRKEVGL